MFPLKPQGKYHIEVCTNISCHLVGSGDPSGGRKKLGIQSGERTEDGRFSLQKVECLAACSGDPASISTVREYRNLTPEKVEQILGSLD